MRCTGGSRGAGTGVYEETTEDSPSEGEEEEEEEGDEGREEEEDEEEVELEELEGVEEDEGRGGATGTSALVLWLCSFSLSDDVCASSAEELVEFCAGEGEVFMSGGSIRIRRLSTLTKRSESVFRLTSFLFRTNSLSFVLSRMYCAIHWRCVGEKKR